MWNSERILRKKFVVASLVSPTRIIYYCTDDYVRPYDNVNRFLQKKKKKHILLRLTVQRAFPLYPISVLLHRKIIVQRQRYGTTILFLFYFFSTQCSYRAEKWFVLISLPLRDGRTRCKRNNNNIIFHYRGAKRDGGVVVGIELQRVNTNTNVNITVRSRFTEIPFWNLVLETRIGNPWRLLIFSIRYCRTLFPVNSYYIQVERFF